MWVLAMFDLPVDTKSARRAYTRFRRKLLDDGFMMLQLSVYARPCPNDENAAIHAKRVKDALPGAGQVRILRLTDMQFSRMQVFYSAKPVGAEKPPQQLSLF